MNNHTWWYIARSGGIIAWVLLAISMFWGLALSSRFLGKRPKPNWMLSKRAWRATHYLSFPLFALATFHLLWVGSDRTTPALRVAVLVSVAAVCVATVMRILQADRDDRAGQSSAPRIPTR